MVAERDSISVAAMAYAESDEELAWATRISGSHVHVSPQSTQEIPPSYSGGSWFKYEDEIDEWCDMTKGEPARRGPSLKARLEGAVQFQRLIGIGPDRDRQKDPENGVEYFRAE